jgi:hypothetical protein
VYQFNRNGQPGYFHIPTEWDRKDDSAVEQAHKIAEMGSKIIKIRANYKGSNDIDENSVAGVLKIPTFDTFFFWWRNDERKWQKGHLTEKEYAEEREATRKFAVRLLNDPSNKERTFFLGNWEGDWILIGEEKPRKPVPEGHIEGMKQWFKARQEGVDLARKDVPHSKHKIYHYVEVNRVRDAFDDNSKLANGAGKKDGGWILFNADRLVNKVLPFVDVDYVSYSSYDIQDNSTELMEETLKFIENHMGSGLKKEDRRQIPGRRVFIGECGYPVINDKYEQQTEIKPSVHEKKNREMFMRFLKTGVPYIIYWEMYNNETSKKENEKRSGIQRGFWLIDDMNKKWPLYFTMANLFHHQVNIDIHKVREESAGFLTKYDPGSHQNAVKCINDKDCVTDNTWISVFSPDRHNQ